MRHVLKFEEIEVGIVEETDGDFPSLRGRFRTDMGITDEDLLRFIELSTRESDLVEEDHLRDIASDLADLEREMAPYMRFVESDAWVLESETGETLKILAPSFKSDGSIVWRWRF